MNDKMIRRLSALMMVCSIMAQVQLASAQTAKDIKPDDSESAVVDPLIWDAPHDMPAVEPQMDVDAYHQALADAVKKIDMAKVQQPDESLHDLQRPIDADVPWNPQTAYWSSPQRDSRWNDQMLVACTVFDSDPKLAATCLWDARNLGYKGWLLTPLETRIAWRQWRFDDALDFGSVALADTPDDRKPVIARWMYAAAKANYKYEEALQLVSDYPAIADEDDVKDLREAVRLYKINAAPPRPTPLAALKNLSEIDLSAKLAPMHIEGGMKSPDQTKGFSKTRRLKMEAPGGRYQLFAFGPKAADVDFSAHFSFHSSDNKKTGWDRYVGFAIADPADKGTEQCEVTVLSGGRVQVLASAPAVGLLELPTPKWRNDGTVRIIVLGPDMEVFVDGKRAYYGAIRGDPSKRSLGFLIQACGVKSDVREVSWKKIVTAKDDAREK